MKGGKSMFNGSTAVFKVTTTDAVADIATTDALAVSNWRHDGRKKRYYKPAGAVDPYRPKQK